MTEQQIGDLFRSNRKYLLSVIHNRLYTGCPKDYMYDCLEDVFTIALEKKDDEKFNNDPDGWLVVTARRVVDNFNRKNLNRQRIDESNYSFDLHKVPSDVQLIEDLAYKMALENGIWDRILQELKPEERVLLIMRYYQNKTPEEIAKEIGIKVNNVNVKITRMKKSVRKLIRKYVGS